MHNATAPLGADGAQPSTADAFPDADLLRMHLAGCPSSWPVLAARWERRLRAFFASRLGDADAHQVHDLAHSVLLRLHREAATLLPGEDVGRWLNAAATAALPVVPRTHA